MTGTDSELKLTANSECIYWPLAISYVRRPLVEDYENS